MCGISAVFELKGGNVNVNDVDEGRVKLAAKLDRKVQIQGLASDN